jgi:DNA-binding beta-propeller fold protein YncE
VKSLTLRRAVIAVALAGSGVVLIASTAAVGAGPDRGALQQLGGPKGCWVFQAADGCSVYSVPRGNGAQVAFNTVSTAVSPDGANLYVAANSYSNLIIAFARASDGSLAPVRGRGGCILPLAGGCQAPVYRQRQLSGLAVSPDGRDLYSLADYRPVEGVQTLIRVAGGGLRGAQSGVSCGTATGADADDRRHKCEYTVELGSGPRALALSPDGHEIYAATDDGVVTLDRTQTGGVYLAGCLGRTVAPVRDTTCAPVRAASDASGVAVSPDGRYVYLASAVGLDVFARNAKTGGLTQLAGTAGCVDATGAGGCAVGRAVARPTDPTRSGGSRVTMSRDGQNVYLAAADGIAAFARSAKTGALTQLAGPGLRGRSLARRHRGPQGQP